MAVQDLFLHYIKFLNTVSSVIVKINSDEVVTLIALFGCDCVVIFGGGNFAIVVTWARGPGGCCIAATGAVFARRVTAKTSARGTGSLARTDGSL